MEQKLTHFDPAGRAFMVDVSEKAVTHRTASAEGTLEAEPAVLEAILAGTVGKGDVLGVARIAGIMAVKQTASLIPLCHPLPVTCTRLDFFPDPSSCKIRAVCTVECDGKTGVEMEALTGVSAALLTIYDMCKAISKRMILTGIHLTEKSGGKSGDFRFCQEERHV